MTCHSILVCFCVEGGLYRTFLATAVIMFHFWFFDLVFNSHLICALALIISDSSLYEGSESCSINFIKIPLVEAKSIPVNFVKVSLHERAKSITVYLIEISLLVAKRCTASRKTWNIIINYIIKQERNTHNFQNSLQTDFTVLLSLKLSRKAWKLKAWSLWKWYIELNMLRKIYLKESNRFANPNTSPARESIFLLARPLPPENLYHMTDVIFFYYKKALMSHCAIDFLLYKNTVSVTTQYKICFIFFFLIFLVWSCPREDTGTNSRCFIILTLFKLKEDMHTKWVELKINWVKNKLRFITNYFRIWSID